MRARDNPLTVQRLQDLRYRFDGDSREALLERFAAQGHRGAIVGPEGHGKTTLLRELGAHFTHSGWQVRSVRLRRAQRAFSPAESQALSAGLERRVLLVVDGVDELSSLNRFRLKRWANDAGGLLVASHREGYLPTLWHCRTSPELLEELLDELGLGGCLTPDVAQAVHALHGGNLREVFSTLYDLSARLPGPPAPEGPAPG